MQILPVLRPPWQLVKFSSSVDLTGAGRADDVDIVIFDSDDPPRAATYVCAGVAAWLVAHQGIPVEELRDRITRAIAEERAHPPRG